MSAIIFRGQGYDSGVLVEVVMSQRDVEVVRQAYTDAVGGNIEPLAALFAPDVEWRGVGWGGAWRGVLAARSELKWS